LLDLADAGESILLFSTDPAHSLSDSLGARIGDRLTTVANRERRRLVARELDAPAALARFKKEHSSILAEIVDRGTLLDEDDIGQLLNQSLPGMDEVMALFELQKMASSGRYRYVVIDTAPTGHTSALFRLPEAFAHWIGALDRLAEKHRFMMSIYAGREAPGDEVDAFLKGFLARLEQIRTMLYDARQSAFTIVTTPDALSADETFRYLAFLRNEGVPVTDLIINRVEAGRPDCGFCSARFNAQAPQLRRIARKSAGTPLRVVPLFPKEVRGFEALRRFARIAWPGAGKAAMAMPDAPAPPTGRRAAKISKPESKSLASPAVRFGQRRIMIFGGKGGVGKTTAAAAAAIEVARDAPDRRVLIVSTDPAPSLSDCFGEKIGPLKRGVAGHSNLDAIEIDAQQQFEQFRQRFQEWVKEATGRPEGGPGWEIKFEREAIRELTSLAPAGIDEITALAALSGFLSEDEYRFVILDTAPSGHLVRFLELPQNALAWVRTLIRLLLKYKNVVQGASLAEELIGVSRRIKTVAALLADPSECEFIGVASPERMSLSETVRLGNDLRKLGIPMTRLLINGIVPDGAAAACRICRRRLEQQRDVVGDFVRAFGNRTALYAAPQQPGEIRGRKRLREHFAGWRPLRRNRLDSERARA
jgi:arsenite-transporting ATPase